MSAWKTVTWTCGGCRAQTSERFHVATDGDPARTNPLPPAPWTADSRGAETVYLCGACSAARAAEVEAELVDLTFGDAPDDAAAVARWRELHLCLRCAQAPLCRVFDATVRLDDGGAVLATVARCRRFSVDV